MAIAIAVGITSWQGPATAQELMTYADPDALLNIAKGYGAAELTTGSDGDPVISGRIEGMKYLVFFYGCTDGKDCTSIQITGGYADEWTVEKANEWNYQYRFITAYEGSGSNFKLDLDMRGVTRNYVDAQFGRWSDMVGTIKAFIAE